MRSGGGKEKGSGFEREICAELSLWISTGERKDCFWRSASSGGRATVAAKKGSRIEYAASDIAPVHPLAYKLLNLFAIECKFYADLHLQDLPWPDRASNIATFWRQVCRDAEHAERHPFLIAKQNRKPILVGVRHAMFVELYDILFGPGDNDPIGTASDLGEHFPFLYSSTLDLVLVDYQFLFRALLPEHLDQIPPVRQKKQRTALHAA